MNSCVICNAPSTKRCTACLGVYYCSIEHQKQDWKNHKGTCLPYKIKENAELGQHMVAARKLARGQLVLKERPLRYSEEPLVGLKMADFDIRSPMKQNCCANCYLNRLNSTGERIFRAVKDIVPGEVLSVCYPYPLEGNRERRRFLTMRKMSICTCIRCLDPTELGTHVSSLKCPKTGCNGLLVPPDNDHLSNQPWQCQNCREETSAETVESFISSVRAAHSVVDRENFAECQDFINRFEPYFHENHFLLTDVRFAAIYTDKRNLTEDDWRAVLKYCQQLGQLFDKVAHAEIDGRGYILLCKSLALMNLYADNNQEAKEAEIKGFALMKLDPDLF